MRAQVIEFRLESMPAPRFRTVVGGRSVSIAVRIRVDAAQVGDMPLVLGEGVDGRGGAFAADQLALLLHAHGASVTVGYCVRGAHSRDFGSVTSERPVPIGRWVNIHLTHTLGKATLSIDGVEVGRGAVQQPRAVKRTFHAVDGGSGGATCVRGYIYGILVWNRSVCASEVDDLWTNQDLGFRDRTLALYSLNLESFFEQQHWVYLVKRLRLKRALVTSEGH